MVVKNDHELYSAGGDGLVVHWDLNSEEDGRVVAKVGASIYAMAGNGSQLVVGENFDGVHVLDLEKKKETKSLKVTDKAIFDVEMVDGNYWIATGGGEVLVVSGDMQILQRTKLSDESARSLQYLPSRQEVAVGFSDNSIRILNARTFQTQWSFDAHQNSVFALALTRDGKYLVSTSRDARFKVWNVENYTLHTEVVAHMYAINSIDFSPNGQYFVTCSMDKSLKVWETKTFKLLKVIDKARHAGHGTSVNKVKWMSNDRIASCSDDRTISIWSIKMIH